MKLLYFVLICLVAISKNDISSHTEYLSESQKDPFFEGAEQRKLAEGDNYIVIYFNKEVVYNGFQNQYRNNIEKIVLNTAVQSLDGEITIPFNTGLEVHFSAIISSVSEFFSSESDENAVFISSVDFSNFDSSNLINMDYLFKKCSGLKSIDFSNSDLSKVTRMYGLFYGCSSLESVTLPENLQSVTVISHMFNECSSLKSIDLSNADLSNAIYLEGMFGECISLESVTLPENLQNVEELNSMFHNCLSLKSIDLSNIALSKVTDINNMFSSCSKLETVIFSESGPQNLESMSFIMNGCSSLTSIDLSMFSLSATTSITGFISGCDSLVAIDFPTFNLTSYSFLAKYQANYDFPSFKYLNLLGFSGNSSYFANLFSQFYQLSSPNGFTSLAVCVSDKEIIKSARTDLNNQGINMDLDFCCNYTECRSTKAPNYIIVNFNKECTYENGFENNYRPNIYSIFLDGVEKEKNERLDIEKGSKMIIHFRAPLTDFSNFFSSQYDTNVKNIISIDFSNFNSSLIDNFSSSFKGCTSIQSLDLSSFIVSSESILSNMVEDCSSLVAIDISNFDLTNKEIHKIFKNIGKLQYMNLINCLGETNDIYTLLNYLKGLNNDKKLICLDENKFNDVTNLYEQSNNGDSFENSFEKCCTFNLGNLECGYVLVSFMNGFTYESGFENEHRANIETIILDGVKKSKNESLEIQAGSKMKIYFTFPPTSLTNFFNSQYDRNVVNIDSIDFSHMDLSTVTNMSYLFQECSSLESVTFSKYTPKNIKSMECMFLECIGIKSIDLSNFIISPEVITTQMFNGCKKLIAVDLPKIPSPGQQMLYYLFEQLQLKYMNLCSMSELGFSSISFSLLYYLLFKSITKIFICLNEQDYSALSTSLDDLLATFGLGLTIELERCCEFNLDILECELPPTIIPLNSEEFESSNTFIDSGGDNYIVVYFNGKIDYSNFMNKYRTNVIKIVLNGKEQNIGDSFSIQSGTGLEIHFNEPVESLEHFFDQIIDENAGLISSIDFSHFNSSKLSNMNSIFSGCTDLETVDFTNFDWSNVEDIGYMFYSCDSLKSIDFSNADLSKVTNMDRTFQSCDSLESIIFPELGPQNIENMDYMFYYCPVLKSIDLSKFDLSKIINMNGMFQGCYSLESVTFSESLQNIEEMDSMFSECSSLKSIDLSIADLSKVTNMENMFEYCESLESVAFPVSGPQSLQSMSSIMNGCSSLTSIDFSKFKLSESTTITNFISACDSLVTIDFPIFDLETYKFFDKLGPIQGSLNFKYINLFGTTGTNENFADFFKQLYNDYNLTSLSICVNDEEIIKSAQSIFSNDNEVDMELKYCCNYPICKIIETTNIPLTSILEDIEQMTTSEFYVNERQSSFVDEIEPKSSSGLFYETKTTDYEDNTLKSTSIKEEIELKSTTLDNIEQTTFNNDNNEIQSTSIYYNDYQSNSNIQKTEPKSTYYENKDDIESKSSFIDNILVKSTFLEDAITASTSIAQEKITTTEGIETKDSNTEEVIPKSTNVENIDTTDNEKKLKPISTHVEDSFKEEVEPKSTNIEYSDKKELKPKTSSFGDISTNDIYREEAKQISTNIEDIDTTDSDKELEPKSTINKEEVEPKNTIFEGKESKSTNLEDTQRESTNEENIESKSTDEVYLQLKSTNLEEVKSTTINVVETKSTNVPDIEIKSTTEKHVQIESTNVEEVHLKSTNIENIGIKSTNMEEIQIESTIPEEKGQISTSYNKKDEEESEEEEKETKIETERQLEEEKKIEENQESQTEEEYEKRKRRKK